MTKIKLFDTKTLTITQTHHGRFQDNQAFDFTLHDINQDWVKNAKKIVKKHQANKYDSFVNIFVGEVMIQLVHAEYHDRVVATSNHWHVAVLDLRDNRWRPIFDYYDRSVKIRLSPNYNWKTESYKWTRWENFTDRSIATNSQKTRDINKIFSDVCVKWNKKTHGWSFDDGNDFGRLRGLWNLNKKEEALDLLFGEISSSREKVKNITNEDLANTLSHISELESQINDLKNEKKICESVSLNLQAELEATNETLRDRENKLSQNNQVSDKFNFDKFLIGLSKFGVDQTLLVGAILSGLSYFIDYVELLPSEQTAGWVIPSAVVLGVAKALYQSVKKNENEKQS